MDKSKLLVLVAAVGGVLGSGVVEAKAKSGSEADLVARLERRLQVLEQKLEESEAKNLKAAEAKLAETDAVVLKKVEQKVKVLERKLEVEKEVADAAKKAAPKLEAGPEGFKFTSANGEHQLRIRGFIQADADEFVDTHGVGVWSGTQLNPGATGDNTTSRFWLRRVRPQFAGTLFKYADFLIAPDFGQGQVRLFDAWADLHYLDWLSLNAGKQKSPISLERLQGATNLTFMERGYPTGLAPNRETGFMFHGEVAAPWGDYQTKYNGPVNFDQFFTYQVGVFQGTPDNTSPGVNAASSTAATSVNSDQVNNSKDVEGRIFAHPFQHSGIEPLEGLGIGIAGSYGAPTRQGILPSLVSIGQNPIVSYSATTYAHGTRSRIYPQAYWYWDSFGLLGEWTQTQQDLGQFPATSTSANQVGSSLNQKLQAWQIIGSWMITGEKNSFGRIVPREKFNPFDGGGWGALQFAARWTGMSVSGNSFVNAGTARAPSYLFLDPRSSVSGANTMGFDLNWYLNENVKIVMDYEQTWFNGGWTSTWVTANGGQSYTPASTNVIDRPAEKVVMTRFQINF